jgi:hypothetical protein
VGAARGGADGKRRDVCGDRLAHLDRLNHSSVVLCREQLRRTVQEPDTLAATSLAELLNQRAGSPETTLVAPDAGRRRLARPLLSEERKEPLT